MERLGLKKLYQTTNLSVHVQFVRLQCSGKLAWELTYIQNQLGHQILLIIPFVFTILDFCLRKMMDELISEKLKRKSISNIQLC